MTEETVATLEKKKPVSSLEEKKKLLASFDIPLSIFHYKGDGSDKGYGPDLFTSWYNVSSEIFKEINRACPEKRVLNLALSVLMFPYIVFTALGLVIYNKFKTNNKTQISSEENKTKKSEVSESIPKRLAYGVLAAIVILVSIPILLLLLIPATPALATFYLLNRKLSHSLIAVIKISNGLYQNEHQSIEVSFRVRDAGESDIRCVVKIKFPPQFEQLLNDLCKNGSWFDVTRDAEHNTILKLSANIHLKKGLVPLRDEIRSVLATSIQGFAKTMEELIKLEKKDITYDKLKELLNEFRLEVVNSVGPKLTSHLIQNAYQVAFIQAIKIAQERRKDDFSLEDALKDIFVKQELESQGKELPSEEKMIKKDLKKAGAKVPDDLDDSGFPVFKAEWERLKEKRKIAKRTIIDVYNDIYPRETVEALRKAEEMIKELKRMGEERYGKIHEELKEVHKNRKNSNLKDNALKRKLEDLFKFEYDDQEVERRLIKSVMKKAQGELSQSGVLDKERLSLIKQLEDLKKEIKIPLSEENLKEASDKVNDFIAKMYLEITKCKMQSLFKGQAKGIEDSCELLKEEAPDLVKEINSHRMRIEKYLERPEQPILLRKIIEGNKDLNKYLKDEQNSKGKEHPNTKLIEMHLENNQEILKALGQLESERERLLINGETKNGYKEKLMSCIKIKFAIIGDKLLAELKRGTFDGEAIKKLLEKAELVYCLAEKCIKYPVIKTKDNIKHFCQGLLSPLIDRLVNLIINNVPKDNESGLWKVWNSLKVGFNYNVIGWSATVNKDNSTEGKALNLAHDTYEKVGTFFQHFQSSYEEVGAFLRELFSDNGETFKKDIWPHIMKHLYEMWYGFFKDIEFTLISGDKNVCKETEGTVSTQLDGSTVQEHNNSVGELCPTAA
ncbi:hypothetical protein [Wolbachia endosymbiont of Cantharis cryptica]|uniref:hypothetical protein n=1 Tax=Wolbachia endosymbiont of Cantharis cryptica TaxID=3066132 RepID=UPI00376ED44C